MPSTPPGHVRVKPGCDTNGVFASLLGPHLVTHLFAPYVSEIPIHALLRSAFVIS
jgi:hypothetical protein